MMMVNGGDDDGDDDGDDGSDDGGGSSGGGDDGDEDGFFKSICLFVRIGTSPLITGAQMEDGW